MQAKTKVILIIVGSALVATGLGVGLYFLLRKPKVEQDEMDYTASSSSNTPNVGGVATNSSNTGSTNHTSSSSQVVSPTFNSEGELSNGLTQLKGQVLYPKRIEIGGWGYTNVRTSAEINTDQGWWDPSDNLITTINSGTPIGSVLSESTGLLNGYSYRWLKVKLIKPVGGFWSNYTEGYVRADTVTIKAYTP